MNQKSQNGLQCSQFEALLAEALDAVNGAQHLAQAPGSPDRAGVARAGVEVPSPVNPQPAVQAAVLPEAFETHRQSCADCGVLFAEAQEGMLLLRAIPEVEPPRNLIHNILAATSLAEVAGTAPAPPVRIGRLERWRRSLRPSLAGFLHSRFAASFAMAFFSLSLTLTLAGVNFGKLGKVDWHPSALRRSMVLEYTHIEANVIRYYDNMKLVYVFQSGIQELKKATAPQNNNNNSQPDQQNRKNDDEQQNFNQESDSSLMAKSTVHHEGVQL
jgi:hypothetical protein